MPRPPPRARLDVRGLCRSVTVTLLRADGRPLPITAYIGAEVTALDPNGDPLPVQPELRRSRIVLTTHQPYVDLTVRLQNYREVCLPQLRADCTVHVEPVGKART